MSLQPLLPLWVVVIGFVLLLGGLAWLEVRLPGRWQSLRLTALVLALLSIAALLLRPSREQPTRENPIVLLTQDFAEDTVDSLLSANSAWKVYRAPGTGNYPNSTKLDDWVDLSGLDHRISAIVGEGLPAFALEYLSEKHFQYFPAAPTAGIQQLARKTYIEGQTNTIHGTYFLDNNARKLLLEAPGGPVDSIQIEESGLHNFSLDFTPRSPGLWQYHLVEKDSSGQVIEAALLPLRIAPKKQLRILILQAFPTFEVRYLKDFLADRGHAVAVRSQISRKNFRTEFANLPARDLSRLTDALLDDFDLLLADAAAFSQISRNERYGLGLAVERGLGFLGLINGESAAFQRWLGLMEVGSRLDTVRLDNGLTLPAYPLRTQAGRDWYPLQRTNNQRTVAAFFYQGKGKIGFQAAQESYAYLLRGDSLAYASLWMPVLEGCMRETFPDYTIELLHDFPIYAGAPLDFRITANRQVEVAFADSLMVPLQEHPYLRDVWYGRTWPSDAGWHQIEVGEERLDFYAFENDDWSGLKRAQVRQQNLNLSRPATALTAAQEVTITEPISRIWWYVLFLLSAGFLWLAPKL